ncbi:MAG: hypothetical protein WA294_21390 [Acidobacteriaceae bacterium]
MAKPIQLDFPARDHEAEMRQRLADAPAEHAAAILEFLELLDLLHEQRVLTTLRGAVGAGNDIAGYLAHATAQPESIRALRNAITLAKMLGEIDPELLDAIHRSLPKRHGEPGGEPEKVPGLFRIAKTLWSPPVRRALFAGALVLAGIGTYLERTRGRD